MRAFFESAFKQLADHAPFPWQCRLFGRMVDGDIPDCCDLPTGLGKTSVMTIWLIARAHNPELPRRLIYVVDRRAVVDQATAEAEKLQRRLREKPELAALAQALHLDGKAELPVSTLRGRFVDNRSWLEDPARPAIVVGTVDMIGSRLLFSGYGVAPRTRPYHAGLLGADTLVVLDEAHLCPPFEALLRTIAEDAGGVFAPCADRAQRVVPPFLLLSLSATGREAEGLRLGAVFRLGLEDCEDTIVRTRLAAPKRLSFEVLDDDRKLVVALVNRARVLGEGPARVLVYCHSRDQAVEVKTQIDKWFEKERREHASELLVGARRVHERERLAAWLTEHGFLGTTDGTPEGPTFLIATSAGEVGVDLDADHMVCDLVEWERMVQRLGRVNRRGEKQSRVEIIAALRKDDESERLERLRAPLDLLPADEDGRRDASPGALTVLKDRAAADLRLKEALDAATTPAPLRPALTRALVDAWSMTSLEEHTGRPEIQPWLRGWETEEPQTTLAWRRWLPWREDLDAPIHHEVERFFGAAPVHLREVLETETHRVVDLLSRRAAAVMKAAQEAEGAAQGPALEPTAPALLVLRRDGHLSRGLTLKAIASLRDDKRRREEVFGEMIGATVVVDARLGGLDADGMLDRESEGTPTTLDAGWDEVTLARIGYRVVGPGEDEPAPPLPGEPHIWRLGTTITLAPPEASESSDERPLKVFVARGAQAERRGDLTIARQAQTLKDHHAWAAEEARRLAEALDLPPRYCEVLVAAARHHDAGKDRELWQSAMNARREGRPYAKTEGGGDPRRLNGYRHEFGSLREVEAGAALDGLHEDMRDLACHLIVAHHGQGRPTIEPFDSGRPGAWESRAAQESRAREVALRFARLQRRFGPWGLAWLEALLRAADWRASARLDTQEESAGQPAEAAE